MFIHPASLLSFSLVLLSLVTASLAEEPKKQETVDYTAVAEPAFAHRLALTDAQRSAVAKILDDRVQKLVAAKPAKRPGVLAESNKQLAAVLSDAQKAAFAAATAGGKLRFNFREQKWADVLDWFARQSELSLVMENSPPGLFTYSDDKRYSPAEAVDLLNSVLLSKGFTLMRREKMLILVDTSDGIPFEMAPKVTVEELTDRGRFEIVTVAFPLGGRPLATCQTAVQELIGKHGRVTPLTSSDKLLVTETAGKLRAINEVIAAVPVPKKPTPTPAAKKPPAPIFAVYPAKGLDPQATIETLKGLFEGATVQADANAEEIHAFATPSVQAGIKASLEKMTASVSGENRATLEIYPLDVKDLLQVQAQLALAVPKAQITVDDTQQRLLVVANIRQQAEVKKTLKKLGAAGLAADGQPTVAVYPVKTETTDALLTLLTQVLPRALVISQPGRIAVRATPIEQKLAQTTIDQFKQSETPPEKSTLETYVVVESEAAATLAAVKSLAPKAQSSLDSTSRRLIVIGSPEEQRLVGELVKKLSPVTEPQKTVLIAYPLKLADASVVVKMLQELRPEVRFAADVKAKRVLVTAPLKEHPRLEAVIKQLDAAPNADDEETVKPYRLKTLKPSAMVELLQPLVPAIRLTADDEGRRLLAACGEFDHQRLERILARMDVEDDAGQVESYDIGTGDAEQVRNVLMQLTPQAVISTNPKAKSLIVWASKSDHATIKQAIEQFTQRKPDQARQLRTYPLPQAIGSAALSMLQLVAPGAELTMDDSGRQVIAWAIAAEQQAVQQALKELGANLPRRADVALRVHQATADVLRIAKPLLADVAAKARLVDSADPEKLLVWATAAEHKAIEKLLIELAEVSKQPATSLRVYPIKDRRLTAQMVVDSLDAETANDVSIQVNVAANSLIVRTDEAGHGRLKQAIAELVQQLPPAPAKDTKVYRFEHGKPSAAVTILQSLIPEASIVANDGTATLAATASMEDLARIKKVIDQMEQSEPNSKLITQIYRFRKLTAQTAQSTFLQLVPTARVAFDDGANVVIATASEADHLLFREAAAKLDGQVAGSVVRVYPFEVSRISAAEVVEAIDDELKSSLAIQVNEAVNSLIVRGSEDSQKQLQQTIDAVMKQLPAAVTKTTKVYSLKLASPESVQAAVTQLIENGTVVPDVASGSLLVTATSADHQRVAAVIEKLDAVSGQQPVMRAYPIKHADANEIYQTVSQAFNSGGDISVTFQPLSRTLFVVAKPNNHEVFQGVFEKLDQKQPAGEATFVKVYTLTNIDGELASSTLNKVFEHQGIQVRSNSEGNALIVVATASQHKEVDQSLQQMAGADRELEVFTLQNTEPSVVEDAVTELFADARDGAAPSVSSDYDSQRLFVRGTKPQIEQIRKLLARLGEQVDGGADTRQSGNVRTIPFRGDSRAAVQRIEQIWSKLRPNRLQVIKPATNKPVLRKPGKAPKGSSSQKDSPQSREASMERRQPNSHDFGNHFVAWQKTTRIQSLTKKPTQQPAEKNAERPPIIVVPEKGRITIASPDHEALDQFESLLRALSRGGDSAGGQSKFAIFLLENTGAADMQKLLEDLFKKLPPSRGGAGVAVVVADERLNALVVHASRKDREMIEELLQVLDASGLPDPFSMSRPEMVALKNTQADRVLTLLQSVYKTQLTRGGGRRQVSIPEGVSASVASVLQQINAAASGPVLTLEVDDTTNSIVMRAPPELRDEIKAFIQQLDRQASELPTLSIRVIRLRSSKAERMQEVLQHFIHRSKVKK